jgi:putative transposase
MSRPLRIDYPNAWHHVMNRARRREDLFVDKADYQQFIDLLQETAALFHVNVAAFCLMPTHILCRALHKKCYVKPRIM